VTNSTALDLMIWPAKLMINNKLNK